MEHKKVNFKVGEVFPEKRLEELTELSCLYRFIDKERKYRLDIGKSDGEYFVISIYDIKKNTFVFDLEIESLEARLEKMRRAGL